MTEALPDKAPAAPFAANAPEATFSLAQLRVESAGASAGILDEPVAVQPVRAAPPSYREIRSGRTAAAARVPIAEVRIPLAEIDEQTLLDPPSVEPPVMRETTLPCMDQLVERVRQRTAARLSRAGSLTIA